MSNIDLGNAPVGTPPNTAQKAQLRSALGIQDELITVTNALDAETAAREAAENVKPFHQLPLKNVKNQGINNITVMQMGDSLNRNLQGRRLYDNKQHGGFKLLIQEWGTNVTSGASAIVASNGWITKKIKRQNPSSTTQWAWNGNTPILGDKIGVGYLPRADGGTITVQYSTDNFVTWRTAGTIDTSASTDAFNFVEFSVRNNQPNYVAARIVNDASGVVDLCGVGIYTNSAGYYNVVTASEGGLDFRSANTLDADILKQIFNKLDIDMVLMCANEPASMYDQGAELDQIIAEANLGHEADWVLHTPNVGGNAVAQQHSDIRDAMIAWAKRTDGNVIDVWPYFVDFDFAVENDLMIISDEVHPFGANGFDYVAEIIRTQLSLNNSGAGTAISTESGNIRFSGTTSNGITFSGGGFNGATLGGVSWLFGDNGSTTWSTSDGKHSYHMRRRITGNPYDSTTGNAGEISWKYNQDESNSWQESHYVEALKQRFEGTASDGILRETSSWPRSMEFLRKFYNGALDVPTDSKAVSIQARRFNSDNSKMELVAVFQNGTIVPFASVDGQDRFVLPTYADDAAADADAGLLSGQRYKLTGSRAIYQKP